MATRKKKKQVVLAWIERCYKVASYRGGLIIKEGRNVRVEIGRSKFDAVSLKGAIGIIDTYIDVRLRIQRRNQ